jgi:hypothetical protein
MKTKGKAYLNKPSVIMKKLILMLVVLMGVIGEMKASAPIEVEVSFIIARPKYNCERGTWICNLKGKIDLNLGDVIATLIPGEKTGTLVIVFKSDLPSNAKQQGYFMAEKGEEIQLSTEMCRLLNLRSGTKIIPGKYAIQSDGRFGRIVVNIQ